MTASTISRPAVTGVQTPRVCSAPDQADTFGDDAIKLAGRAGLHLYPWQQEVLRRALGVDKGGRWTAFETGLVVPRQNGKGSVLEALELFHLFLPEPGAPPPLILHSAHEFRTSAEHFRRMRTLVENTPMLRAQVRATRTASGSESIELKSGARIKFATRTSGSGRGFSADLVVLDEAYKLSAEQMAAILPTLSARPNPQVWYASSAGMAYSQQLAGVRERGLRGGDRSLCYLEWSAVDGADLDDRQAWAQANPSLGFSPGVRESIVEAERAALPDEEFGRERLGLWAHAAEALPAALDEDRWKAAADPDAGRGQAVSFGVAAAPDQSWSAVAVAWRRPDSRLHVMVSDYRPGTGWVEDRVKDLRNRWGGVVVVDVAARSLVARAEKPGEDVQAQAHNRLATLLEADLLRHGNQAELNVSARSARWHPRGNTRLLERKGETDISPLAAAALAVWQADRGAGGPSSYESEGFTVL